MGASAEKTLWIVSGGTEAVPGILRAKELGCHVVVSDGRAEAPGAAFADDFVLASTYDVKGTVKAACEYHKNVRSLDGVTCIAADVPLTVASVADALDLPGIPVCVAELAMDKLAMKRRFASDAVAIPWFSEVENPRHLKDLVRRKEGDLVIKPVDSRGARGVLRLKPDVDLDWAFSHALGFSPTNRVMVETFLAGPQVSTESLVIDGQCHTPGFSDRNYEFLERYAPHMIENGGDLPSFLPEGIQEQVKTLVGRAARSMGIHNGVVKGDIVVSGGMPHVIELAARLSGGYFCSHEIPLNTGVDLVGCAIRQSLGEEIDDQELQPRFQRPICQRYLFPEPGDIVSVEGEDQAASLAGIEFCEVRVKPGDRIEAVDCHPARAGVIIASGATRSQAQERARAAVSKIRIKTKPMLP